MTLVTFHSGAEADLRAAVAYYERQRKGLGLEFRQEVEATVQRLRQLPQSFPLHDKNGTRKCLVRRFPFTIFFTELPDSLWIVAVAHHRRQPDFWSERRPG